MTTKEETFPAVILKRTAYKENDMILHVYTQEFGKIALRARGIRKMTSKNAIACQEMMISEMVVDMRKGLSSLRTATPLHYLRHIKENLESEIVGNYILEYYYRYVEENQPSIEDYEILIQALKALDQGFDPRLVSLVFDVFILNHNGVSLQVDGCVICGKPQVVSISLEDGGFLCQDHLSHHSLYSKEVLQGFRHIHKCSMEHIDALRINEDVVKELMTLMNLFIDEYTGIHLKSSTFLSQIV